MKNFPILMICGLVLVAGCKHKTTEDPDKTGGEEKSQGASSKQKQVEMLLPAQNHVGMVIAPAEVVQLTEYFRATGTVQPIDSHIGEVSPLSRGRVVELKAKVGDRVRAGQTLAVFDNIEAVDLSAQEQSAKAELASLNAKLTPATRQTERSRRLADIGAGAEKDYEFSKADEQGIQASIQSQQAVIEGIRQRLRRYGSTGASGSPLTVLKAPFAGVVTKAQVSAGDTVEPGKSLFTIADLFRVWVQAEVYEKDLGRIRLGQDASIKVDTYPDESFSGRVAYISDVLDPQILTLSGVEGKMFKPMAATVLFALTASLVVALMLMPVLSWYALRKLKAEKPTWIMRKIDGFYGPVLRKALAHPAWTGGIAFVLFAASLVAIPFLGAEFIPSLDEGSILVQMYRVPGISITESLHGNEIIEKVLREFPEVSRVVSRTGSPEVATDPMAIDQSDVYVTLKSPDEWPKGTNKNDLIAAMKKRLQEEAPGAAYSFSQPIQMRMQELMEGGSRSDLAIKLYGEDLEVLRQKADQIAAAVTKVQGAADVRAERVAGLPYLRVRIRRDALARHGLDASAVLDTIEAIGGKPVGEIVEGNRRFTMQVRFPPQQRNTTEAVSNLRVGDSEGHFIPLAQLADIQEEEGPAQISREGGQRRISVEVNVRGRDLAGFVAEAQKIVSAKVKIPDGYELEWGGQFQQLQSASRRLMIVVPAALLMIFVLLYFNFQATLPAALIFLNIPLAATGGIIALTLRGMPFSISAGVGFIALFGIAVLNGIVLLTYIREIHQEGLSIAEAAERGAETRLRPVLMTALVASLGFIPMAISTGAGAEVQRPLATVVIGGLVTSTLLTLLVLPSLYKWIEEWRERKWHQKQKRNEEVKLG
jgi:RND family efflux transporter MFP subunit